MKFILILLVTMVGFCSSALAFNWTAERSRFVVVYPEIHVDGFFPVRRNHADNFCREFGYGEAVVERAFSSHERKAVYRHGFWQRSQNKGGRIIEKAVCRSVDRWMSSFRPNQIGLDWGAERSRVVAFRPRVHAKGRMRPVRAGDSDEFCHSLGFRRAELLADEYTTRNRATFRNGRWRRKKSNGSRRVIRRIRCSGLAF